MRTRLGPPGLAALVLVVATACASGDVEKTGGGTATELRVAPAVSTSSDQSPSAQSPSAQAPATAKTARSGCNAAGTYEICFSCLLYTSDAADE